MLIFYFKITIFGEFRELSVVGLISVIIFEKLKRKFLIMNEIP
jgi:hypothetical protein